MSSANVVPIKCNPISGSGSGREEIQRLTQKLEEHGFTGRLFSEREELSEFASDPSNRQAIRAIVAAGGDGTVGDLINRHPEFPISILPLGTENLLAKHFGLMRDGALVADVIAEGFTVQRDLGVLKVADSQSDRRFAVMASFGIDADVVHRTDAQRTGRITKWNYFQPMLEAFRTYNYPELRLYVDDAAEPVVTNLLIAVNLPAYALGLPVAAAADGSDGLLDLRLFHGASALQTLRHGLFLALNQHEQMSDVECMQARRVRIESDAPVPAQVDGDPAGTTPASLEVYTSAFSILVPRPDGAA